MNQSFGHKVSEYNDNNETNSGKQSVESFESFSDDYNSRSSGSGDISGLQNIPIIEQLFVGQSNTSFTLPSIPFVSKSSAIDSTGSWQPTVPPISSYSTIIIETNEDFTDESFEDKRRRHGFEYKSKTFYYFI